MANFYKRSLENEEFIVQNHAEAQNEQIIVKMKPHFSLPFTSTSHQKFIEIQYYVLSNIPATIRKTVEQSLYKITDVQNRVHKSNVKYLFQDLGFDQHDETD